MAKGNALVSITAMTAHAISGALAAAATAFGLSGAFMLAPTGPENQQMVVAAVQYR